MVDKLNVSEVENGYASIIFMYVRKNNREVLGNNALTKTFLKAKFLKYLKSYLCLFPKERCMSDREQI